MAENETTTKTSNDILDNLIRDGKMARDELQLAHSRTLIGEFVNQVDPEQVPPAADLAKLVLQKIAQIDEVLTQQVNAIMHDERFQKLEGSWRGLNYLVMNTETSTSLKLRVMHATKKELLNDLEKASNSIRAICSRRSMKRSLVRSAALPTAAWLATMSSVVIRRTSRSCPRSRTGRSGACSVHQRGESEAV